MNKSAFDNVIKQLHIQQVYLTRMSLNVSEEYVPVTFSDSTASSFGWLAKGARVFELVDQNNTKHVFIKFGLSTVTKLVRNPTGQALPPDFVPSDEDVIATIEIDFAADYVWSGPTPIPSDDEGITEFAQHNLPYHVWPYWREVLQNVALRSLLPVPNLPFYQVHLNREKAVPGVTAGATKILEDGDT